MTQKFELIINDLLENEEQKKLLENFIAQQQNKIRKLFEN